MPSSEDKPDRPRPSGGGLSDEVILHASCVALEGRSVVIMGPSGSGKSSLALNLMQLGATLVSDDQTILSLQDGKVFASAPESISGKIEVRFVGLLNAKTAGPTEVGLFIDLSKEESHRLPERHVYRIFDQRYPLLFKAPTPSFAPAIVQFLRFGRAV